MGNIAKNVHSKFDLDATRNDGALGFFQTASPPNNNNNNNNNKKKKISSVWGPVPGPKKETINLKTLILSLKQSKELKSLGTLPTHLQKEGIFTTNIQSS